MTRFFNTFFNHYFAKNCFLLITFLFIPHCVLSLSTSDLINNYCKAETGTATNKVVKAILKSTVPFDEVYQFLSQGRSYSSNAKTGFLNWDRRTKEGIQLFALIFIPYDYTPEKKWPLRVILHGDISHDA